MEEGGKGSGERRLSTLRENLGAQSQRRGCEMRGPPCPQTLWSGQVYLLLMFCDTSTNICPLLCQQKGLQHPQASGCAGAAHTHTHTELPAEPGTPALNTQGFGKRLHRSFSPGPRGACAHSPPGSPCTSPYSNLMLHKARGGWVNADHKGQKQ